MNHSLRQQREGLPAAPRKGEQTKIAPSVEFVRQQPHGRIAGGQNQSVRGRSCELLATLPLLIHAVMSDDSKIGGFGRIQKLASTNRRPPISAGIVLRLPGPGDLASNR